MTKNERIVESVDASMNMEGMPLTEEEKKLGLECLNGEKDFRQVIDDIVKRYTKKSAER